MTNRIVGYILPVGVGWIAAISLLTLAGRTSRASMHASPMGASAATMAGRGSLPTISARDSFDLHAMLEDSEADRAPKAPKDWLSSRDMAARDRSRVDRVKQMYKAGLIATGSDNYEAAVLMQRSRNSDDLLLAHDLSVVALSMGYRQATWLSAETEDKFLKSIGRPQRFATQYEPDIHGVPRLYKVDPNVTDNHRISVGATTLVDASHRILPSIG